MLVVFCLQCYLWGECELIHALRIILIRKDKSDLGLVLMMMKMMRMTTRMMMTPTIMMAVSGWSGVVSDDRLHT